MPAYHRLSDIVDIETLAREVTDGFVRESTDASNPELHVLCYTPAATYTRHWNAVTHACRGLLARYGGHISDGTADLEDAIMLSRGIPKFFCADGIDEVDGTITVSLTDDDEEISEDGLYSFSANAPAHVSDKLDGAMGVTFIDPTTRRARIHTKGSTTSDEALAANRILEGLRATNATLDTDVTRIIESDHMTPVFEILCTSVAHIVDYGNVNELRLLGAVDHATGEWFPVSESKTLSDFADRHGIATPEVFPVSSVGAALALPERKGCEGVVVCTHDGHRQVMLKVKYEPFLALQQLRNLANSSRSREIATRCLADNITTVERADALDNRKLANLCGIDAGVLRKIDAASFRRIALMRLQVALSIVQDDDAPSISDEVRLISALYADAESALAADPNLTAEKAYVSCVLSRPPELRPVLFAAKDTWFETRARLASNRIKDR